MIKSYNGIMRDFKKTPELKEFNLSRSVKRSDGLSLIELPMIGDIVELTFSSGLKQVTGYYVESKSNNQNIYLIGLRFKDLGAKRSKRFQRLPIYMFKSTAYQKAFDDLLELEENIKHAEKQSTKRKGGL